MLHYTSAAANRYVSAVCQIGKRRRLLAGPAKDTSSQESRFKARQKQTTVSLMMVVEVVGAGDATIDALQPWKR